MWIVSGSARPSPASRSSFQPFRCPICGGPSAEGREHGGSPPRPCPYATTPYPRLCYEDDELYFGKWREMTAERRHVKGAQIRLEELLARVEEIAAREGCRAARENADKAARAFLSADPEEEPFSSIKFMDQALSYVHHAINDLIRRRGGKAHDPTAYEALYNVAPPFGSEP